jgi:8-oxo-dGTP pyrophosphatase MutT (NUDIX family)
MISRKRSSVVLVNEGYVALVFRKKEGLEYFTFPGGGIEPDETPLDAAVRELSEELSVQLSYSEFIHLGSVVVADHIEEYFMAQTEVRELVLVGPELERQSAINLYRPCWVPIESLKFLPLLPQAGAELALRSLVR